MREGAFDASTGSGDLGLVLGLRGARGNAELEATFEGLRVGSFLDFG